VPSRGAAQIGGQPPAMVCPDTVALSMREFQAANRHGNGRRESLIAISIPFGSIGAIALKTAVVRGNLPSSSTSKKKRGMVSSQQVRTNQWGVHLFAGLKQPCQKLGLLSWQRFLVAALRPKPEGAILV
jgi:hypothetical protein